MATKPPRHGQAWPDKKRIEVVTTYLVVGNAPMTEAITGVSRETIRHWKMTDWWKEVVRDLQDEENIELSSKLKKIVDKSIDVTLDRLENGDTIFNPRTGELLRVPIKVKDALKAADTMIDKRQVLMNRPTKITETRTIDDRLNKLAEEFRRFSSAKQIEGEIVNDRQGEIESIGGGSSVSEISDFDSDVSEYSSSETTD